jgi:hypothetical protein
MEQMYAYVPGVVNVCVNWSFLLSTFELIPPVMKLTVWAMGSLFVHATVVPTLMVSAAGVNLKLMMLTADAAVGAGAGTAVVAGPEPAETDAIRPAGAAGVVVVAGAAEPAALAPQAESASALAVPSAAIRQRFCPDLMDGVVLMGRRDTSSSPGEFEVAFHEEIGVRDTRVSAAT